MPVRWKIFAIANYICLIGYGFLLFKFLQFYLEVDEKFDSEWLLTLLSLSILVTNSLLNIVIFHRYFPNRVLSSNLKKLILLAGILFAIALSLILFSLYKEINEFDSDDEPSFRYFILFVSILVTITGLFILASQFVISRYLEKSNKVKIDNLLENIGKEE
jgi:hypothetical protein